MFMAVTGVFHFKVGSDKTTSKVNVLKAVMFVLKFVYLLKGTLLRKIILASCKGELVCSRKTAAFLVFSCSTEIGSKSPTTTTLRETSEKISTCAEIK